MKKRCPCGRPARANGLCQTHYKKQQRVRTNSRSADSLVSGTTPPENGTSDQDFVRTFSDLTQNEKTILKDGKLQRGDEYQLIGVYCPDCRGEIIAIAGGFPIREKPDVGWCVSDRHPIFDATGRVVQMARPA